MPDGYITESQSKSRAGIHNDTPEARIKQYSEATHFALVQPLAAPQEFDEGLVAKLFGIFYSRPSQIGARLLDVSDVL